VPKALPWIQTVVGGIEIQRRGVCELALPILRDLANDAITRGMVDPPRLEALHNELKAATVLNRLIQFNEKDHSSDASEKSVAKSEWSIVLALPEWVKIIGKADSTIRRYSKDGTLVARKKANAKRSHLWTFRMDTLAKFIRADELERRRSAK